MTFLTDIAAVSAGYSPLKGRLILHYESTYRRKKSAMIKYKMHGVVVVGDEVLSPSKGSDFYRLIGAVLAGEDVYFSNAHNQYKLTVTGHWADVLNGLYAERETSYWRNTPWRFWTCLGDYGRMTNGASGSWLAALNTEPVK